MIVCQCAGVTDTAIQQLIAGGVRSLKDIVRQTGAGRCCAPCRQEIASLLNAGPPAVALGD